MTITTFRKLEVKNFLSFDYTRDEEIKVDGFIYLTDDQEIPTEPDYIQNYLHIFKNDGFGHKEEKPKKYYLYVDRGEYQSDQVIDLENILFDWADGEYHQGTYKIEEINQ